MPAVRTFPTPRFSVSTSLRFFLCLLLGALGLSAAPQPLAHRLTDKERAQGYSDRVILAKPRADHRARVDSEENREHVRIREKFSRLGDLRVIEVDPGETVATAIARLQATGRYEFVEPDQLMQADAIPNDPSFPAQWSLNNTGQLAGSTPGIDIDAPAAWDIIHDAPGIIVAVIDSGMRVDHADLAPNLWVNPNPTIGDIHGISILHGVRSPNLEDNDGHGTRVAGIIGAAGNNGIGMAGIAWSVKLMVLKNSTDETGSLSSDGAACMDYAVAHGAHIINCSFGGSGFSQTFLTAIQAARDAGVIVVCSAGNDGLNSDLSPHYPSNYLSDNVVSVGYTTSTDTVSASSNYGAAVDLLAPGSSIPSLNYLSSTGVGAGASGTSFAAPHVTGSLALLKARFPSDSYRQLINRLLRGVEVKSGFGGRAWTNGRLNLQRALTSTINRPVNDDFSGRALVTGSTLAMRSNNVGATTETGEPVHGGIPSSGTLWWQWIAPNTSTVVLDTVGSAYDTTLAVYTGSSLGSLVSLAFDDDGGTNGTSKVSFSTTTGTSYMIAISSKTGGSGYTQLNVSVAPPNDFFTSAMELTGESARATTIQNNAAGADPGEPAILGHPATATLWYKWTAPRSGRFQVSAFTTDFDMLLAVYTGTALENLSLVTASDDTGANPAAGFDNHDSRCTIDAVAGTTYYFQADTKNGTRGSVYLTVTDSLWQFSTENNSITAAPAIGLDGTIYIGTASPDRRLYAVTPSGTMKWSYSTGGTLDMSTPSIAADGTIYLGSGSGSGYLTALSPSGNVLWTHTFTSAAPLSPAIAADGTIYTHALDGVMYALNPADGTTRWSLDIGATTTFASAIVAPDGTIYQGSTNGNFYAINPNGTMKWQFNAGDVILSTAALDASGNIYFGTYTNSRVFSLTPAGSLRWTFTGITLANGIGSSPTLSANGNTVYLPSADRKLYALNAATGVVEWSYQAGNVIFGSTPAIDSNGVIYFGAYDGKVYAVNANGTLKRTWDTAQPIRGSPRIYGTTLYIASSDGKLYAFDIGATAGGGPWPQFRQNVRNLGRPDVIPPASRSASAGSSVTLDAGAAQGTLTWVRNGTAVAGATNSTLTLANLQPVDAGIYQARVTSGSVTTSTGAAIVGLANSTKLVGPGTEFPDIFHPGTGFTYDQILLGSGAAAVKADAGQILRISFVDLTNDIVQVEFSGAGTLSLVLDAATGPALPVNYDQAVNYMKGHAGIVLTGADVTTNLSVFSVGRANAANQALFKDSVTYDGFADIAFIAITSTDGKFGGLRAANASCFATKGITGLYAPGVEFTGPVFIGDIRAESEAIPMIVIGSGSDTRITGGDLLQTNNRPVQVSGLTQLRFVAGSSSHGTLFNAQANRARLEQNGVDVTNSVVVNPTP